MNLAAVDELCDRLGPLDVTERDARRMRGERPFVFTNLRSGDGLAAVIEFIEHAGMLAVA